LLISIRNEAPPLEKSAWGFQQAGGAAGRVSSVQSRFALRSVIATNQDISNFGGKEFARKKT